MAGPLNSNSNRAYLPLAWWTRSHSSLHLQCLKPPRDAWFSMVIPFLPTSGRVEAAKPTLLLHSWIPTPEYPNHWQVAQSCPTLCDPMDCSLPGSSVQGIFQARVLEWGAIAFSRESFWPRDWTRVSCIVGRCFTIWATRESSLNISLSPFSLGGQEYWSGLPFPSLGDLPNPGIEPRSPTL